VDIGVLNYIFNICIIIGFLIPLLNLLTGWFGSFFGAGIDMDTGYDTSVDIGDATAVSGSDIGVKGGVFPFNIMCLCLSLVVFGALGQATKRFMTTFPLALVLLVSCILIAALSYYALYTLVIKRLKNSNSSAITLSELPGKNAVVTLGVTSGSIGTISLFDSTGAAISFRAKIDPELAEQMNYSIKTGEPVFITDVDKNDKICYISTFFTRSTES
jgi:hypothetical protein